MIDSGRRALPGVLFLLLLLAVYADPLFSRRNFGERDLLGYNLPIEKAVHDAYARGRWPVWIDEISGGRPLLPNINVGALYPIRALLAPISFPMAMRIYPVLHWALAGLGVMALLSTMEISPGARWVGAVTYVFSGVGVSQIFYTNHHPGVALLPWVVWSVAREPQAALGRYGIPSALIGLDFLAGDVFLIALALVAAALWILFEKDGKARSSSFAALGVALAMGILLALPQLVATLLWVPETTRAVSGMRLAEALRFSVSPWRLLELAIPYPFGPTWADQVRSTWASRVFQGHTSGYFSTLYAGSFGTITAIAMWPAASRGIRFARAFALLGLALCVLPSFVPASWGNRKALLPFRYPEKMSVALVLAAAIFAAVGFDQLRARGLPHWPLAIGIALAILAMLAEWRPDVTGRCAAALLGADPSSGSEAASYLPAAIAVGGLLWMAGVIALHLLPVPGRVSILAALLLTTGVPIVADRWIARSYREEEIFAPPPFVRAMERRDPTRDFRALGESHYIAPSRFEAAQLSSDVGFLDYRRRSWLFYTPSLWRRGVVFNDDFDAGDFSRLDSLRRLSVFALRFEHPEAFFENASVRFGIRFPDQSPPPGFSRFGGNGSESWDEDPKARPSVRLLESWKEVDGPVAASNALPSLAPGQVTLETGGGQWRSAKPASLKILEKSAERLRVEVDAPEPTYLFVLRGFWPHRLVTVDGASVSVVPAQLAFSAAPVLAGRHEMEWNEFVPGASVSRWGPVLWAIALSFLAIRERRQRGA
jgi:hypothetical protein